MRISIAFVILSLLVGCSKDAELTVFPPDDRCSLSEEFEAAYYKAADERALWNRSDNSLVEVYRISYIMGGSFYLVRLNVFQDGNREVVAKELSLGTTTNKLVLLKCVTIAEQHYEYFTNLLHLSGFWDIPHEYGAPPIIDVNCVTMEGVNDQKYHLVIDYGRIFNPPLGLARKFLFDLPFFVNELEMRETHAWPMISYSSAFEQVRLATTAQEIAKKYPAWQDMGSRDDLLSKYGVPHEAVTTASGGAIWRYYLQDRGLMHVYFDLSGRFDPKRSFVRDAAYGVMPTELNFFLSTE